jgi:hypothetical protein
MALALAGTAACSYIFDLPNQGAVPIAADASVDAGTDVAEPILVTDAVAPIDAAPPFCPSQTAPSLFCADFDDAIAPELASFGAVKASDGKLDIANVIAQSTPRSLVSIVSGTDASASIVHPLGSSPDRLSLASDLLVSAWETTGAQLMQIELSDDTSHCFVRLSGGATTWSVTQECTSNDAGPTTLVSETQKQIERRRWQRFTLSLTLTPTKAVTLYVDGVVALSVTGLDALHVAPASVALGVVRAQSGTVALFQDNVLVTNP